MGIGKDIAEAVVALMLDEAKRPAFSATLNSVNRSRLPAIQKKELPAGEAVVRVSFVAKEGDEQDRSSEFLIYQIAVSVSAHVPDETAEDNVESFVEEMHDYISERDNWILDIGNGNEAELELPFVNDPIYEPQLLRDGKVFLSVTIFNYRFDKERT